MAAFTSFHAPGFWLVIAVLGGVAVAAARPFVPAAWRTLLFAGFWIGLPYLALVAGGVSPRLMGLLYIDWITSLRLGVGLALALIAVAAVARLSLRRGSAQPIDSGPAPVTTPKWALPLVVIAQSGAEEFFWCFLRGAVLELMLTLQIPMELPIYWSIWIAAVAALPLSLTDQTSGYARLVAVAVLVMTSILFFYTRNFWLCWFVHAMVWLLLTPPESVAQPHTARSNA